MVAGSSVTVKRMISLVASCMSPTADDRQGEANPDFNPNPNPDPDPNPNPTADYGQGEGAASHMT